MRSGWRKRLGLRSLGVAALAALAVSGSAGTTTGCAGQRDEIDRVQPLALKKADFVGDIHHPENAPEFYMRSLITQVQRTNPWFSDGLQDLTRRVRFEITENFLIVRNAYEYIKGTDGKGGVKANGDAAAKHKAIEGYIVAVYPIRSHFNIQQAYNPITGEVSNVREENASDVPWHEREYFRVDWSTNLVGDPNQIFWWETFGGDLRWKPVAFFEADPKKPADYSNFAEIGGGYFDVTSRWIAGPETFDYYGYQVPYCLLQNMNLYPNTYSEGSIECSDQEVTLRTSFWKVDAGRDYEAGEITSWMANIQANLTLDRSGYDRNYGIVDDTWHIYQQKYNIWDKSHTATICGGNNVKKDGDATCAEASGGLNSVCDMNAKRCTIPYTDRKVRQIDFFLDPELPEYLWPTTEHALGQWNKALKGAVSYAREAECRRAGGEREACHGKYFKNAAVNPAEEDEPTGDEVVVMCHNPVLKGDHPSCGQEGKKVRKGDIREHMIAWWNNPSFNKPLGVIVWSGDPTTGENIGSTVNIFGASVEDYSAYMRDQIMLVNGDLTPSEYVSGVTVDWYGSAPADFKTDPIIDPALNAFQGELTKVMSPKHMTKAEMDARLKAVDIAGLQAKTGAAKALAGTTSDAERFIKWNQHVSKQATLGTPGFADTTAYTTKIAQRLEAAKKAGLEQSIVNDLWVSSVGIDPTKAATKPVLDAVSPLRAMNPTSIAIEGETEFFRAKAKHTCSLGPDEMLRFNYLAGAAAFYKSKYPDGAAASGRIAKAAGVEGQTIDKKLRGKLIYQELLEPMYEFTLLHEMGHLMSMEHQFAGSYDAINYNTEYWTYRAQGKTESFKQCDPTTPRAPGSPDTCIGPRYIDPLTEDELGTKKGAEHHSIESYAVDSVMDYKFDTIYSAQLAPFDKMAAKYIYGGLVELFDDEDKNLVKNSAATAKSFAGALGLMNADAWYIGGADTHYTQMGIRLNLFDPKRCRPQTAEEKDRGIGALGLVCQVPHRDHALVRDMVSANAQGFPATDEWKVQYAETNPAGPWKGSDGLTRRRWPYKVSDGNTAYVHSMVYDSGADFYELTQDILDRYGMMYLDYFFRMGRRERNVANAGRRMYGRFFDRVQSLQWNALSDVVRSGFEEDPAKYSARGGSLSLTQLFDAMQSAFLRPQPGAYTLNKQPGSLYDLYSVAPGMPEEADPTKPIGGVTPSFWLGVGDARYVDHRFDLKRQYDYRAYAFRAGSFLEKPFAAIALTDARPKLSTVARETYLDGRNVMFSFRSALPQAFDRLVAGVMADDWDTVGPYIDPASTKDAFGMTPLSTLKLWDADVTKITRPAGSKVVDPMLGFRQKVPAVVLMMLYQPIDSSMDLINRTRIWVPGSSEGITIPDSERVVFFDPSEGIEWNAKSFGQETLAGKIVDQGIGARMMEHANELLLAAYDVESEPVKVGSTQLKAKYDPITHRPLKKGTTVAITKADVKDAAAAEKLRLYVGFLNQVRVSLYYLGFGPCGYSYDRDC